MAARCPPGPEPTTMRSYFSMVGGASIPNGRRRRIPDGRKNLCEFWRGRLGRAWAARCVNEGRRRFGEAKHASAALLVREKVNRSRRRRTATALRSVNEHLLTARPRSAMMLKICFLRRGSDFGLRFLLGVNDRLAGLHSGLRELGQYHLARDGEHPPPGGRWPGQARDAGAARRCRKRR